MSSRRPGRRSRIYDSNFTIGENYYKSALDRIDQKYNRPSSYLIRHSEPPAVSPTRPRYNFAADEEELDFARDRASKVIQHETLLDQRTGRKALDLEPTFDNQVQKTLDRIQASKKLLSSIDADDSYDNELASSRIIKKRSVKVVNSDVSSSLDNQIGATDLTKWSKLSDFNDSESFAAARARQSAARLQDIEQDMFERSERQRQRSERAANVKKLLAETSDDYFDVGDELTNGVSSLKISKRSQKQVQTY